MARSCGTANSSTPVRLSLPAILAETATVRRDATHDVTGVVWTRKPLNNRLDLLSERVKRCSLACGVAWVASPDDEVEAIKGWLRNSRGTTLSDQ